MRGGLGALLACIGLWTGSIVVCFGALAVTAAITSGWSAGRTAHAVLPLLGAYAVALLGASAIAWRAVSVALGPGSARIVVIVLFLLVQGLSFFALAAVTALALNR